MCPLRGLFIYISQSVSSILRLCLTLCAWTAARHTSLSITNYQSLLKLMFIESVMPSNCLILCLPFSSCLQSFPTSGSFQKWVSSLHQVAKSIVASASASVLPLNIQGWFPLGWTGWIPLQSKSKSLFQYHSSKASIIWCSALFMVQILHPYITNGKTKALTRQTFVGKVIFLLFNKLSRLVITFLPRS